MEAKRTESMVRITPQSGVPHKGRRMMTGTPSGAPEMGSPGTVGAVAGAVPTLTSNRREQFIPATKKARVLSHFLTGAKLNRFEAERIVHDHCLHSSVSTLQREHGLVIDRVFETVPALKGLATARVCRYWLHPDPDNLKRARAVLSMTVEATE
jgi:hypothetical protein